MAPIMPGEGIAARPLHFMWIVDCSGSMQVDGKMAQLNNAIKEALPEMQEVVSSQPFCEMFVRAIAFSSGANWVVSQPTPVADFKWNDLQAEGVTDMGAAFEQVADQLSVEKMGQRGYPPVLVLISDGQPTDDWKKGLKRLLDQNWGKRASRIAIAIGKDADHEPLKAFVNNPEIPVLQANNPQRLTQYIKWASAVVSKSVVAPPSKTAEAAGSGAGPLPPLLPLPEPGAADDDVW